jgi:electron transfer flavoprotein alpha subunit
MRGSQSAAAIAAETDFSCITGVESVSLDQGEIMFKRSILNGKMVQSVTAGSGRAVITLLPGSFSISDTEEPLNWNKPGTEVIVPEQQVSYKPLGMIRSPESDTGLEEADIIIAAGNGIGARDNLDMVRELAALMPGAAIGGSRPICDRDWLPYAHQVGSTGKTVAPKAYIACGISGSSQHTAGMKGSRLIISINTDPNAAIFSISDYCIIEDCTTFLPVLAKLLKE